MEPTSIPKERRHRLHQEKLNELHATKEVYDQIRRTTTLTENEAAIRARNNLTGSEEIHIEQDTNTRKTNEMMEKISSVRSAVKNQYRSGVGQEEASHKRQKKPLLSSELTDYDEDWATGYCNLLGGITLLCALALLYIMWFTNLIK